MRERQPHMQRHRPGLRPGADKDKNEDQRGEPPDWWAARMAAKA